MERRLVVQAQRGDQGAFTEIALAASQRLFSIAHGILRDFHLAEDVTQRALVTIWRQLPSLREPDKFEAWSSRVVVHACYEEARRGRQARASVRLLGVEQATADSQANVADRDMLERAFERLSPEQRAVLVLQYYLDHDLVEIADILGVPLGTVKSRASSGRTAMRAALEADARPGVVERTA